MRTLGLFLMALVLAASDYQSLCRGSLDWVRAQQGAHGAWGRDEPDLGTTALAVVAHLALAHSPAQDQQLSEALHWMTASQEPTGSWPAAGPAAHGMASFALSEALGAGIGDELAVKLTRAVAAALAVSSARQRPDGAWARSGGHDVDPWITLWQVQALVSARQCGFALEPAVLERVERYFRRQPAAGDAVTAATGLLGRQLLASLGAEFGDQDELVAVLQAAPLAWQGSRFFARMHSRYLALYLAVGETTGRTDRLRAIQEMLVEHRNPEGWWHQPPGGSESRHDRLRSTCLAILALSQGAELLPIWSR
ncbi:MAG: hypothetical protein ACOCXJ_04335 [Planctomycetota bacterium]